jgi:hypothetical protein
MLPVEEFVNTHANEHGNDKHNGLTLASGKIDQGWARTKAS